MIHFSGVEKGEACTIVLRGASNHILDEAERSLHDALCVLVSIVEDFRIIYGAGFPEMKMARAVDESARRNVGKKSAAIQGFAKCLRQIPAIVLDNAGHDSSEIVSVLRAAHEGIGCRLGFDVIRGEIGTVEKFGIIESYKVKLQILLSAVEATECILTLKIRNKLILDDAKQLKRSL
jgi:T-complex protein 1 subunit beta